MSKRNYVTIVTGIPRSGTSCMCRMLETGGMEVLHTPNAKVPPRQFNPHGYYEYQPARSPETIPRWISSAENKAIKLFLDHVSYIPADTPVRAVCMYRDIESVRQSCRHAFGTHWSSDLVSDGYYEAMRDNFSCRPNVSLLEVSYASLVTHATFQSSAVADFLGGLDAAAMVDVIDHELRHF